MPVTRADLENWFRYHPPTPDQVSKYNELRDAGYALALMILRHTPSSADQTTAIRTVREAIMWANAAIACGESLPAQSFPAPPLPPELSGQPE